MAQNQATEIRARLKHFPTEPGVYIMKNDSGQTLYVGKAKNLRNRVRSYFTGRKDPKTTVLISHVHDIEHIVCRSEYEALLLENSLIKKWQPRYNINLKDGKTYPVIRLTNEQYPRVFRTRRVIQDGSTYFGPYTNVGGIDAYLEIIERMYPLRKCRGPVKPRPHPCLYYHMGRCTAVCAGKTPKETYLEHIDRIRELLSGDKESIIVDLTGKMHDAGQKLEFERAAQLRDTIRSIESLSAEQQVIDHDPDVRDYVGFAGRGELATFVVFQMRGGRLVGSDMFRTEVFGTEEEDLVQFLLQYYSGVRKPPTRLFLPLALDTSQLDVYFRDELESAVTIEHPQEGRDSSVLNMARENAIQDLERRIRERGNVPALEELARVLGLEKLPYRIEGFDIAHIGGKHTVASLVSFLNGVPDKGKYRSFNIRSLDGKIDDFEAMREVTARRYSRLKNDGKPIPDLILIDGGLGQVNAVQEILESLELGSIPVVGLAKEDEELYFPENSEPVRLPKGSEPLRVLQYVRDEAHRFATGKRAGKQTRDLAMTTLESVPGLGPKRLRQLLAAFNKPQELRGLSAEQIASRSGIPVSVAEALVETLSHKSD